MRPGAKLAASTALMIVATSMSGVAAATSELQRLLITLTLVIPRIEPPAAEPTAASTEDELEFPFLDDEPAERSVSIGDTSHGRLAHGERLEESPSLAVLASHRERDIRWGTDDLVRTVEHAAHELYRSSRTRLWVGNLARRGGGNIDYSVSHNSGRDADIAFCYRDRTGKVVDPPELVPLNRDGLSTTGLLFDAARTWTVIKALMFSPQGQVQYLFISEPLKIALLMHAKRQRENPAIIERAAVLLREHGAHNDHLHLRIFCSSRDVGGGCENSGVIHPWTDEHREALSERTASALAHLAHSDAEQRRRAVERLVLIGDASHIQVLLPRLDDDAVNVRRAAARALTRLGGPGRAGHPHPGLVTTLAAHYATESDATVRMAIVHAIGELGGEGAGRFLASALSVEDASPTSLSDLALTLSVVEAAARAERLEPVPALIALLDDHRPSVRAHAARALFMTTNVGDRMDWENGSAENLTRGQAHWQRMFGRSSRAPRDAWLVLGFRAEGLRLTALTPKQGWELVRAITRADHVSFNAQRVLARLFAHHPPSLSWPKNDACHYWLRWLDASRERYDLGVAGPEVRSACDRPAL